MTINRKEEPADPAALRNMYDGIEEALNAKAEGRQRLLTYLTMLEAFTGLDDLRLAVQRIRDCGTTPASALGLLEQLRTQLPQFGPATGAALPWVG